MKHWKKYLTNLKIIESLSHRQVLINIVVSFKVR